MAMDEVTVTIVESTEEVTITILEPGTPVFGDPIIKTLSTGVVVAGARRNLVIAAESGTIDDMIELTGLSRGEEVLLRADSGDTITIKHNNGAATVKMLVFDNEDFVLDEDHAVPFVLVDTNKLSQKYDETAAGGGDPDAIHDNVAAEISIITEKGTPIGADKGIIEDSEDGHSKKMVQLDNMPVPTKALSKVASGDQDVASNVSFAKQVKGGAATVSFSATKTFSMNNGNFQEMVVTATMTSLAIGDKRNGHSYWIILEIGGSGSYDIPQAGASFGKRSDNAVDDSAADWWPTTVGSRILYTIGVTSSGYTFYSIETFTV